MPNKMKTFKNYYVNVGGAGHRFAGVAFIPIRFGPSFFYVHDDLALFVIESCKILVCKWFWLLILGTVYKITQYRWSNLKIHAYQLYYSCNL